MGVSERVVQPSLQRRSLLKTALFVSIAGMCPAMGALANSDLSSVRDRVINPGWLSPNDWRAALLNQPRSLQLRRGNAVETLTYWTPDSGLMGDDYKRACWMLRDVQAKATVYMDPVLLDVLFCMRSWLRYHRHPAGQRPLTILSGYRTRATNDRLEGAARNSFHLRGRAADIVIEGVAPAMLGEMARTIAGGGVGIYQSKGFVHVDTGAVRSWAA